MRHSATRKSSTTAATKMVGKESMVTTLQLKRPHDWGKVKRVLHEGGDQPKPRSSRFAFTGSCTSIDLFFCTSSCSIASAKTNTRSSDDTDCLSTKIYVRQEVEVSAFAGPTGAHFVEGSAFPSDHPHARSHTHSHGHLHMHAHGPSSFDRPLASAMGAEVAVWDEYGWRIPIDGR